MRGLFRDKIPRMLRFVPPALLLILAIAAGLAPLLVPRPFPHPTFPRKTVTAIVNANVLTLDASGRVAQAVAIRDGRIAVLYTLMAD